MPRFLYEILENQHPTDNDENRWLAVAEVGRAELQILTGTLAKYTSTVVSIDEVAKLVAELESWLARYRHRSLDQGTFVNFECVRCKANISARLPAQLRRELECWNCGATIHITVASGISGTDAGTA